MKRIYASSRVVSSKSTMSVPRRELNGIVMCVRKLLELEKALTIPHENIFLHTDSIVCLYWISKEPDQLTVYVKNRVVCVKEANFDHQIYFTSSEENPADLVSKVKPISAFMGNQLWEFGPNYMTSANWKEGRKIQDIHLQDHTGSEEKEAILQETKKHHEVNFNLTQTSISNTTDNAITRCLNYTNNLNKAKRILLKVIKFLVIRIRGEKMKKRLLQERHKMIKMKKKQKLNHSMFGLNIRENIM